MPPSPASPPQHRKLMLLTRALAAVLLVAGAAAVYVLLVQTRSGPSLSSGRDGPVRAAVYRVKEAQVHRQFEGYGSVTAKASADVPARVSGVIEEIPRAVEAGRGVSKGQVLVKLDPSDFEADLRIARRQLDQLKAQRAQVIADREELKDRMGLEQQDVELARHDLERAKRLSENAAANPQEVDRETRQLLTTQRALSTTRQALGGIKPRLARLDAQIAGQSASVDLARQRLNRATITSPLAGVLQSVEVKEGESIAAGRPVARIVDLTRIEAAVRLPASARSQLAIDDPAVLTTTGEDADGPAPPRWEATVERIAPVDEAPTRTVTVYLHVGQPHANVRFAQGQGSGGDGHDEQGRGGGGDLLVPGAFVSGQVTGGRSERRLLVPRRAMQRGRVLRVRDGVVEDVAVDEAFTLQGPRPATGLDDRQWVAVKPGGNGLMAGDLILVNASAAVGVGQRVETVVVNGEGEGSVGASGEATPPQAGPAAGISNGGDGDGGGGP